jgi:hypothetical protein
MDEVAVVGWACRIRFKSCKEIRAPVADARFLGSPSGNTPARFLGTAKVPEWFLAVVDVARWELEAALCAVEFEVEAGVTAVEAVVAAFLGAVAEMLFEV